MPNRNHLRRLAAAVCTASLAFGVASVGTAEASHSSTCTVPEATQALSSFSDLGWYYLAPGGDFEAGTVTWANSGAVSLSSISHSFDLYSGSGRHSRSGHRSGSGRRSGSVNHSASANSYSGSGGYSGSGNSSLRLLPGAQVTTPKLCVTKEITHLRFLAKAAPGSGQLDVEVRVYDSDDEDDDDDDEDDDRSGGISSSDHTSWGPSRNISLKTDRLRFGETAYVDVRFRSQGDWTIDDVLIDPYRRG